MIHYAVQFFIVICFLIVFVLYDAAGLYGGGMFMRCSATLAVV